MSHEEKNIIIALLVAWVIYGSFKGGEAYAHLGGATASIAPGV